MIKTNQAFKVSLSQDIEYLDKAMKRPLVDVDYSDFEEKIIRKEAARLRDREKPVQVEAGQP
ncbi:hypothetical protein [Maricaulis sp.]|uniref:hypothetical protein n=1 Tax=Maricaulis sp. TaxID=1486257 RepID=UPI001DD72CFA|nr:hypothetical protein [Maricaulis sp.]MCA8891465.1 hypothetical protein [Hyphomonas sp.]